MMPTPNPEQKAREETDRQLTACGWIIQDKSAINLNLEPGVADREYRGKGGCNMKDSKWNDINFN
jgi:type I restriction enzyme, R subunit